MATANHRHGTIGGGILQDGFKVRCAKATWDTLTCQVLYEHESDIVKQGYPFTVDTASQLGTWYVDEMEYAADGDWWVADYTCKGIASQSNNGGSYGSAGAMKVQFDSDEVVIDHEETIMSGTVVLGNVIKRHRSFNPTVTVHWLNSGTSQNQVGTECPPPFTPMTPTPLGTGIIQNNPSGWVLVKQTQEPILQNRQTIDDTDEKPKWIIVEVFRYIPEFEGPGSL